MFSTSRRAAFILPLALALAVSVLLLGTLLVEQALFSREMQSHQDRHQQARNIIRWHVPQLIGHLGSVLNAPQATTALKKDPEAEDTYQLIVARPSEEGKSAWNDLGNGKSSIRFESSVSNIHYIGNTVELSPAGTRTGTTLSWAFEDTGLAPANTPPPGWWPWSSWMISVIPKDESARDSFKSITGEEWNPEAWIPDGSPIPFTPDAAPANVPVITHINLTYGIFATGPVDKPRKSVRIRFYIECGLWNPYNRAIRFHERGGQAPAFMVRVANMPSVRIHNLSTGISTGWIPLDSCQNAHTGESGIEAWIRTGRMIGSGEVQDLSEPDNQTQPEGLARTLHPAFQMGPADEIHIEFKQSQEGLTFALNSIDEAPTAQGSANWFHARLPGNSFPSIHFKRADDPNRPFYLASGSLSFRQGNTHHQILLSRPRESLQGLSDPRDQYFQADRESLDAAGNTLAMLELVRTDVRNLRHSPPQPYDSPPAISILSWPGDTPVSLMEATDLPNWENAFLLGTPEASKVNEFFMTKWPYGIESTQRTIPNEGTFHFSKSLPVNSLSKAAWASAFDWDAGRPGEATFGFPKYANPQNASDYWAPSQSDLTSAIDRLVIQIEKEPSKSIPEFFNRGQLVQAFNETYGKDPLMRFAPIRGLLRHSPPLVSHGSAWILHVAVSTLAGDERIKKSARVWLMKTPTQNGPDTLKMVHFEWTDPEKAVQWTIN